MGSNKVTIESLLIEINKAQNTLNPNQFGHLYLIFENWVYNIQMRQDPGSRTIKSFGTKQDTIKYLESFAEYIKVF